MKKSRRLRLVRKWLSTISCSIWFCFSFAFSVVFDYLSGSHRSTIRKIQSTVSKQIWFLKLRDRVSFHGRFSLICFFFAFDWVGCIVCIIAIELTLSQLEIIFRVVWILVQSGDDIWQTDVSTFLAKLWVQRE